MNHTSYYFTALWRVDTPVDAVFDALADLEHYPQWWPEVREVVGIDEDTARARIRSWLPYTLQCTLFRRIEDRRSGRLVAEIAGDLEGWSSWTITTNGTTVIADYEQRVTTMVGWMNALSLAGRPLFAVNHRLMMKSGHRGLLERLAATA